MAHSSFHTRNFQLRGTLTVTFSNDSVSRSKRPLQDLQDGDHATQQDAKRQCWDGFCSSPSPSLKVAHQPALHSSPTSSRTASQAYALTTSRYRDDSDLDAALLEPSDGEELDSPWVLSPEAEAKLLEDDSGDDVDSLPPFVIFGIKAEQLERSCLPIPSEAAQTQSISGTLEGVEHPTDVELLPRTSPSDICSDGLACRNSAVAPMHGSRLHGGPRNLSSPAFPEEVPAEAASVNPKEDDESSALADEEATRAERDTLLVGQPMAGESASLMAKGSVKEQASIVQELGEERAGHPPGENEGDSGPAKLIGETAVLHLDSASNQIEDCVENPSTKQPKRPARPRQQIRIHQEDLEGSMERYINTVLAHIHHNPVPGPVNELHALMQRVSSERHSQGRSFKHPADLTMRNYAERANRSAQRFTLGQWVVRNQRDHPPFADIPDRFERSSIPSL